MKVPVRQQRFSASDFGPNFKLVLDREEAISEAEVGVFNNDHDHLDYDYIDGNDTRVIITVP